jgi:uncharacterized DUF497 family protein
MIDLGQVVGFEWDNGNANKSRDKHSVTAAEAEQVFVDTSLVIQDDRGHSDSEPRYHALGQTFAGRRLHVTFTVRRRGTLIRVISARAMSRKERNSYESEA